MAEPIMVKKTYHFRNPPASADKPLVKSNRNINSRMVAVASLLSILSAEAYSKPKC